MGHPDAVTRLCYYCELYSYVYISVFKFSVPVFLAILIHPESSRRFSIGNQKNLITFCAPEKCIAAYKMQ